MNPLQLCVDALAREPVRSRFPRHRPRLRGDADDQLRPRRSDHARRIRYHCADRLRFRRALYRKLPCDPAGSGLLAASVSLLYVAKTGVLDFRMGIPLAIAGFVGTVIGGMGSLTGAVLGSLFLGIVSTLLQALLPDEMRPARDAFLYGMVIFGRLWKPRGLFATRSTGERILSVTWLRACRRRLVASDYFCFWAPSRSSSPRLRWSRA